MGWGLHQSSAHGRGACPALWAAQHHGCSHCLPHSPEPESVSGCRVPHYHHHPGDRAHGVRQKRHHQPPAGTGPVPHLSLRPLHQEGALAAPNPCVLDPEPLSPSTACRGRACAPPQPAASAPRGCGCRPEKSQKSWTKKHKKAFDPHPDPLTGSHQTLTHAPKLGRGSCGAARRPPGTTALQEHLAGLF